MLWKFGKVNRSSLKAREDREGHLADQVVGIAPRLNTNSDCNLDANLEGMPRFLQTSRQIAAFRELGRKQSRMVGLC